mmetsp:Transcript_1401/g.3066  ORF Transcript_1401/g.3066 Transcript_1401/m.3066 type:complete len:206 (+) Transcript_1401:1436-2053(+)
MASSWPAAVGVLTDGGISGGGPEEKAARMSMTMAVMLSLEPFFSASSTRAFAALRGSPNLLTHLTAASFVITSQTPSDAMMTKSSPGWSCRAVISGVAMIWFLPCTFMLPSPNDLDVASSPLTLGTPTLITAAPACMRRSYSSWRMGLWSCVSSTGCWRRLRMVRESPTLAAYNRSPKIRHVVAVEPSSQRSPIALSTNDLSTAR